MHARRPHMPFKRINYIQFAFVFSIFIFVGVVILLPTGCLSHRCCHVLHAKMERKVFVVNGVRALVVNFQSWHLQSKRMEFVPFNFTSFFLRKAFHGQGETIFSRKSHFWFEFEICMTSVDWHQPTE